MADERVQDEEQCVRNGRGDAQVRCKSCLDGRQVGGVVDNITEFVHPILPEEDIQMGYLWNNVIVFLYIRMVKIK